MPTKICMWLYQIMRQLLVSFWPSSSSWGGIALFLYNRTAHGRLVRDTLLMQLPLFGPLIQKSAISRFASIFAILQASGVDILDSMDILAATIGNEAFCKATRRPSGPLEGGTRHFRCR